MAYRRISSAEAQKKIKEINQSILKAEQKELKKDLNTFGINIKDKDLKNIIEEIRTSKQYERLVTKSVNLRIKRGKENISKILEDGMNKIDRIRRTIRFYVTMAYMKKQDRLTKSIITLTWLVLIVMIIQILLFIFFNLDKLINLLKSLI